jgi:hypothetical protein
MRWQGSLFLLVLFAAAIIMILRGKEMESGLEGVASVTAGLREQNVQGRLFDPDAADLMIDAMEMLIQNPDKIELHIEDLREYAATAASWADAAASPSYELTASVALRSAAGELRSYAVSPKRHHLDKARMLLDAALGAIEGDAPIGDTASGLRDRLNNLQQSHQEKLQDLDEVMKR